jgi:hypothetical protein
MELGTIQKTITLLKDALEGLGVDIPLDRLENLGIIVHEAMTVQARSFHTPAHIFDLSDASNPVQALAALFHDVVYYEIDQGFTPQIQTVLAPYIRVGETIRLVEEAPVEDDEVFYMTLDVFGFEPGQQLLPSRGQNEYLSALLMNKMLAPSVPLFYLVQITACIEATIPFRGKNEQGETPAQVLERRLETVNDTYAFNMSRKEIREAVKQAVAFSNKDVENFSERDTGRFLDNTWKLLPETNPSLRTGGIYTIQSYRRALEKMEAFLQQLDPDTVFNQYKDEPEPGEYQRIVALAYRNVHTARQYLGLKLLAMAILEALTQVTGGDAPVALFMGSTERGEDARRLEDFLPDVPTADSVDESSTLFGLLAFGRASSSSFDMQNSPLSLFIFKLLGWEQSRMLLQRARLMFAGEMDAHTFLEGLPTGITVSIANACAAMVSTRRAALRAYAEDRLLRSS